MKTNNARALAISVGLLLPVFSQAAIFDFQGSANGGSATDQLTVSAEAYFQVVAGQVQLTLVNTTPHTFSAAELLTGITFTLYNGPTTIDSLAFSSAYAVPRTITGSGSYADGSPISIRSSWEEKKSGSGFQVDFNPDAKLALVGPADGESPLNLGAYNANGSIDGNPGHNPYVASSAVFTFLNGAITDATTVGNVSFIFNTALSYRIPGTLIPGPEPVPEPTTVFFGLALAAISLAKFAGANRAQKLN